MKFHQSQLITSLWIFLLLFSLTSEGTTQKPVSGSTPNGLKETNQMIVVTTPEFEGQLREYLTWKKKRGLQVEVDVQSAAHGAAALQKKLQQKYDKGGLTYIVLIGDIDEVPSIMINGSPSDPSYALLEGDDLIGDAYISRISVNTVTELDQQLKKILAYEQGLFENFDWIHHAAVASMDGFDGVNHSHLIVSAMRNHPTQFSKIIKIMESDDTTRIAIRNAIEKTGVNVIAHHGHGSPIAFESLRFSRDDAASLQNGGGPWPIIHGAACLTGSFHYRGGDCLAEAFMKAGTPDKPAGAIAFLGASTSMNPVACCLAQREAFIHLFYEDEIETIGELCYRATRYAMEQMDSGNAEHLYRRWHLFGDCSSPLWKQAPGEK